MSNAERLLEAAIAYGSAKAALHSALQCRMPRLVTSALSDNANSAEMELLMAATETYNDQLDGGGE